MHKDSEKKKQQKKNYNYIALKESIFLNMTSRLNIIHIALKFHQDIPHGYLLMVRKRSVKLNFIRREVTRIEKARAIFIIFILFFFNVCDTLS